MASRKSALISMACITCACLLAFTPGCNRSASVQPLPAAVDSAGQVRRVEELLIGKYAGVEVIPTNDGGYSVNIRAMGLSGGPPLWIIDGTPYEGRNLSWVNPSSVVKIEVLKNAADIGVYGLRGSSGVILVTTRRPGRQP